MGENVLALGVITDVFFGEGAPRRLRERLAEARSLGAELALLPELPLNSWAPATKNAVASDAEPPDGPRQRLLAEAAREVGIGVVGGVILKDAETGARFNTAVVYGARGQHVASYRKLHLPEEQGFWETSHYDPGSEPPSLIDAFGLRLGVQLCSDINRPELCHALGALGAEAILAPRCTPRESYERWKTVLRANAVTSGAYVVSTNRPGPEQGVPIGGPSIAIAPDGEVLLEAEEAVGLVTLDRRLVREARSEYPGYLAVRAGLYARVWRKVAESTEPKDR